MLTAGHSKEDTAAFLHAQGIEEADMRYQSGVMGVPITFLDKYCPEQFEIVGASESEGRGFSNGLWVESSGVSQPMISHNRIYKRIFISRRNMI